MENVEVPAEEYYPLYGYLSTETNASIAAAVAAISPNEKSQSGTVRAATAVIDDKLILSFPKKSDDCQNILLKDVDVSISDVVQYVECENEYEFNIRVRGIDRSFAWIRKAVTRGFPMREETAFVLRVIGTEDTIFRSWYT